MLGYRLAAKSARDRANGCTYDRAQRPRSDRASRRARSDTTYRCPKSNSNGMRTSGSRNRVQIGRDLCCDAIFALIVHAILRCTAEQVKRRFVYPNRRMKPTNTRFLDQHANFTEMMDCTARCGLCGDVHSDTSQESGVLQ